ncbi:MAG: 50S ribosomal protein L10 [Sphingomonadales bacterium]
MDRAQKAELVAQLKQTFADTTSVVVVRNSGLTVAQASDLRRKMRDAGASFKVTKNRLTRLALDGTKCGPIADLFTGPTGIAFSDDPVAAAKVAVSFAKDNDELVVLGGMMEETVLNPDGVKALATMPSLDELRAKLVGMLNTPATRIAAVTQAPAGQLARVFGAYGETGD